MAEQRLVRGGIGDFGFGGFASPTGSMAMPGTGTGTLGTILGAVAQLAGPLIGQFAGGGGGAAQSFLPALGPVAGGLMRAAGGAALGAGALSLFGNGAAEGDALFTASGRPRSVVPVQGPNGRSYWIGNLGQPLLWSRDLAAKRKVERVAAFARRGSRRVRRFRR